MASTPMDLDMPDSSPTTVNANAIGNPASSLNITRTLGSSVPSTTAISDVIAQFRPTKVFPMSTRVTPQGEKTVIRAASVCAALPGPSSSAFASASAPAAATAKSTNPVSSALGDDGKSEDDRIVRGRQSDTSQLFKRDDAKDGRAQQQQRHVLSLDYDDPGELLMTSESDETIQIYKVREGQHDKMLLSKKYGVKLAKFTHASSGIIYASTKQNGRDPNPSSSLSEFRFSSRVVELVANTGDSFTDAIRYLTTHDNAFLRYFEGHEAPVTCLEMHPGNDDFISCSKDGTVRLWNAGTRNAYGLLYLTQPYITAFDPSGQVFAVGCVASGMVLLYDHRKFDKAPFAEFDVVEACHMVDPNHVMSGWTKLEFANDGRSILLGTKGGGHFLLDSFNGNLKAYLRRPEGSNRSSRLAAGEEYSANGNSGGPSVEGSGDCCFTSDGRYVIGGTKKGVVVWDTLTQVGENKVLDPTHTIEPQQAQEAAVVAWNPRFNFLTTADQDVVFWLPDPEA
ncbi:hypothetical protein DL766_007221 [Monosporascus sp. MC13-8B]|uniref:Anaphase-promoting complex subunit 4 WD40 domain-containing protein n=1 Tax=Monosporascus cannonballus TaxID=155416 RepID=A0ABY0HDN0_9PEZI|nr:hypothetical protein DL763_005559 [Monosporascus cannonballus]RYO90622.1 hypothetical protein DL762_002587 [Monosporascus cannonballus]RYP24883.1 hypothetical protein DL766_007221 [Monosporascus sp. MC13-8B]